MTYHLSPFDTIAEASLLHYPLGARWVRAAFAEYRVDRADADENDAPTETDQYDAIVRRDPNVVKR